VTEAEDDNHSEVKTRYVPGVIPSNDLPLEVSSLTIGWRPEGSDGQFSMKDEDSDLTEVKIRYSPGVIPSDGLLSQISSRMDCSSS
jgi:hypothetical protein